MVFAGTIEAKLDAKGRVFFPSEFRRQLIEGEAELVLQRDIHQPCLVVYPASVWLEEVGQLRRNINRWQPREAMVFRQFLASAQKISLDTNGRLLIPKKMAEACSLVHTVCFIGVYDRVEIWSAEKMNEAFLNLQDLSETMADLSTTWTLEVPAASVDTTPAEDGHQ